MTLQKYKRLDLWNWCLAVHSFWFYEWVNGNAHNNRPCAADYPIGAGTCWHSLLDHCKLGEKCPRPLETKYMC